VYYETLRSVLRTNPHLRHHLKRCCHCRIFFLTESSNIDRDDLGCPFGCSESHRRRAASVRSAAYYRTAEGRVKKRVLNQRRYLLRPAQFFEPQEQSAAALPPEALCVEPIIEHVRMVTSLIEGRFVSLVEIVGMLEKKGRQHSLMHPLRMGYLPCQLNKRPP
jgi:hypothetical protein